MVNYKYGNHVKIIQIQAFRSTKIKIVIEQGLIKQLYKALLTPNTTCSMHGYCEHLLHLRTLWTYIEIGQMKNYQISSLKAVSVYSIHWDGCFGIGCHLICCLIAFEIRKCSKLF